MELFLRSATCFHGAVISSLPEKFTSLLLPIHGINDSDVETGNEMWCCKAGRVTQPATGRYIPQDVKAQQQRFANLKSRNNNNNNVNYCNLVLC